MKLRSDQQVCAPIGGGILFPALDPLKPAIVKQRDHWAFMARGLAEVYFNASHEVLSECHPRNTYDRYPVPVGTQLNPSWLQQQHEVLQQPRQQQQGGLLQQQQEQQQQQQQREQAAPSQLLSLPPRVGSSLEGRSLSRTVAADDDDADAPHDREEGAAITGPHRLHSPGRRESLLSSALSTAVELKFLEKGGGGGGGNGSSGSSGSSSGGGSSGPPRRYDRQQQPKPMMEASVLAAVAAALQSPTTTTTMHRCHWNSRLRPMDVPNECLLDHWLASHGVPFVEALVPSCIRKKPTQDGEKCPSVSFNQNSRLDTSRC
jgi:hypothetical protein